MLAQVVLATWTVPHIWIGRISHMLLHVRFRDLQDGSVNDETNVYMYHLICIPAGQVDNRAATTKFCGRLSKNWSV